jgi:hypothetical protein
MLGSRGTFGMALLELAREHENIVALSGDLCGPPVLTALVPPGLNAFLTPELPSRIYRGGCGSCGQRLYPLCHFVPQLPDPA